MCVQHNNCRSDFLVSMVIVSHFPQTPRFLSFSDVEIFMCNLCAYLTLNDLGHNSRRKPDEAEWIRTSYCSSHTLLGADRLRIQLRPSVAAQIEIEEIKRNPSLHINSQLCTLFVPPVVASYRAQFGVCQLVMRLR